jgi:hypothetical protein
MIKACARALGKIILGIVAIGKTAQRGRAPRKARVRATNCCATGANLLSPQVKSAPFFACPIVKIVVPRSYASSSVPRTTGRWVENRTVSVCEKAALPRQTTNLGAHPLQGLGAHEIG